MIIQEHFDIKRGTLFEEIKALKDSGKIGSILSKAIDDLRHFGNFGAHPKFNSVGEIIQVERDEAEYCIEFIQLLFEEVFILKEKRDTIQKRLLEKRKSSGDRFA